MDNMIVLVDLIIDSFIRITHSWHNCYLTLRHLSTKICYSKSFLVSTRNIVQTACVVLLLSCGLADGQICSLICPPPRDAGGGGALFYWSCHHSKNTRGSAVTRKMVHWGQTPFRCCAKFMTCEIYDYWAICACVKYFDVKYFARDRVRVRVINFADVINFAWHRVNDDSEISQTDI